MNSEAMRSSWQPAEYTDHAVPAYRDNPFIEALPRILKSKETLEYLHRDFEVQPSDRDLPTEIKAHMVLQVEHVVQPLSWHVTLSDRICQLMMSGYVTRNPMSRDFYSSIVDRSDHLDLLRTPTLSWGSARSMAIVGPSGTGKSTAINAILSRYPRVIAHRSYQGRAFCWNQIPWIKLDCPHDGSIKALCTNLFDQVDGLIGTEYSCQFIRSRMNTDQLIRSMARVVAAHGIGLIVIDEIQNLRDARGGNQQSMLNLLVQLNNELRIPVVPIGTIAALGVLRGEYRQARRSSGLGSFPIGRLSMKDFCLVCETLWRHVIVRADSPLTEEISHELYELTQGIVDLLSKLFELVQLRILARGDTEALTIEMFRSVYDDCFKLLHSYLDRLRRGCPDAELNVDAMLAALDKAEMREVAVNCSTAHPLPTVKCDDAVARDKLTHSQLSHVSMDHRTPRPERKLHSLYETAQARGEPVYRVLKQGGYISDIVSQALES